MKIVHELVQEDPDRRLEFCEVMSEGIPANLDKFPPICFSNESTFF